MEKMNSTVPSGEVFQDESNSFMRCDACFRMTCVNWDAPETNMVDDHTPTCCGSSNYFPKGPHPQLNQETETVRKLLHIVFVCFRNCC